VTPSSVLMRINTQSKFPEMTAVCTSVIFTAFTLLYFARFMKQGNRLSVALNSPNHS
jgi:hypothetical protein